MVDIVTRLGKGSPLTNAEVDANFTNLAEVSGVTGEPMGHEDRTTSTISFNASTRTFTIAPVASSFTVWCKGKKVVVSTAQTVTIPNTTGMYSIYYDANGVLSAKSGYFTFSLEAPTAYVYWNAATGTAPYFGDERHGVVLDWQTHEYLHRTRGAALASGFSASGYVLGGNGSSNSHAQITLEGGTFFDEDMKIIVTATNTPTAGTWEQDLLSPARIPVLYLSGTGWVIDAPTDYPLKQGTARPQYNAYSGGVWSTADVANNKYATSWILATNNLTYPVIAIIGQAQNDSQSAAEAVDFTELQLPGFPSVEFRPLYKLIFQCADSCSNAVHASLVSITDIRSIAAAGTAASIVTDHGNLSGLSDDDHPQYIHVDTLRTVSAAVKASFLPSQTSNAGKFLQTDGAATSWQALTSGNVTTALGFTPYNATNPSGYISGISSSDVTTALGFTPYNATNPSGYVTAAGARGAISVTGAGSYDSATGVINIVGGVTSFNTRTGAITLSSADVTTALGFTPYNNTNPSGYITGITSTMVTTALGFTPYNSSNPNGYISSITSANVTTALGFTPYNATNPSGYITSSALSGYLTSASAASTYLPLVGGTLSGAFTVNNAFSTFSKNAASGANEVAKFINSGGGYSSRIYIGANPGADWLIGKDCYGAGNDRFQIGSWNGYAYIDIAYNTTAGTINFPNNGGLTVNSNTILHAGNYSSYSPTLTGTGASGTWGINITGSAGSATSATTAGSTTYLAALGSYVWSASTNGRSFNLGIQTSFVQSSNGYPSYGSVVRVATYNNDGATAELYFPYSSIYGGSAMQYRLGQYDNAGWTGWKTVIDSSNYSSYALPLSGGTVAGPVTITGNDNQLFIDATSGPTAGIFLRLNGANKWEIYNSSNAFGLYNYSSGQNELSISAATGVANFRNTPTAGGNAILHSGNINSYIPSWSTGVNASHIVQRDVNGYIYANHINFNTSESENATVNSFITSNGDGWSRKASLAHVKNSIRGVADGTWGIDISGTAANANAIDGVGFTNTGSNFGTNADTIESNGISYYTAGVTNFSGNATDGALYSQAYSGNWQHQIAGDYRSGQIALRGKNSGTWQSWRTVLDSSNYSSYAVPQSDVALNGGSKVLKTASNGYLDIQNWINVAGNGIYSSTTNSSHFLPNPGSYGSWQVLGSRNGWNGLEFGGLNNGPVSLMINVSSNSSGFHANNYGWQFRWENGTAYVHKNSYGGGTGATVLDSSNYTSYSPSLGGAGANGTWGISVTGNAATAGGLAVHDTQGTQNSANQIVRTQVNGYTMLGWINTTSGDSGIENRLTRIYSSNDGYVRYSTLTDFKVHMGLSAKNSYSRRIDYTSDANYHVGSMGHSGYGANETFHGGSGFFDIWSGTNYPPSTSHIHGFNALHYTTNSLGSTGGNAYGIQVAGQYDQGGLLFSRGCSGGSFSSWRRQIDDNNYNSYSPTLTGGNASGTWGISVTGSSKFFKYDDGPRNLSDRPPNWNNRSVIFDFVGAGTGNGAGNYAGVLTFVPWDGTSASTGDSSYQLSFANQSGVNASGPARLSIRNGINSSWNGWQTILSSSNYDSYTVNRGGDTLTGLWYFRSNRNTSSDSPPLQAFSNDGGGAIMSFHRGGYYAVNFGLDSDNVIRIGGWSASTNRLQMDMSGNLTMAGNVTAYSDERLKKDWAALPSDFVERLAKIKAGTYTRIDSEERQAGVSAQDFQNLLPETVSEDNEGTLSLAYGNAALVSAVELAKDNVELRARIERLESLLNKLIGD